MQNGGELVRPGRYAAPGFLADLGDRRVVVENLGLPSGEGPGRPM